MSLQNEGLLSSLKELSEEKHALSESLRIAQESLTKSNETNQKLESDLLVSIDEANQLNVKIAYFNREIKMLNTQIAGTSNEYTLLKENSENEANIQVLIFIKYTI